MSRALRALAATLLIELPVVALGFPTQRRRMVLVALAANTFTNLMLNLVLPTIPVVGSHHILIGEALALFAEAFAYAFAARPRAFARALVVSGIANVLSYELGGLVASLI